MGFYDTEAGVERYLELADGYDGRDLVAHLRTLLPARSRVLEIGMGPGKDLDLLAETYLATGSDRSALFLDRYRAGHPGADLLELDAVTLETDRRFDAIYSNKVLHHLTPEELERSLARQAELLEPGGLLLHSFWHGEGEEEHEGLRFVYYTPESLAARVPAALQLVSAEAYEEMDPDDSLRAVLRRRPSRPST